MNKATLLFITSICLLTACSKKGDLPIGTIPEEVDFFFTGELDGELLDMHTLSSKDTLLSARVGGTKIEPGICVNDYFSEIYTDLSTPNVEIGFMHFFKGPCESQQQIDEFNNAFQSGRYPFDVFSLSEPSIEKSVSVQIQLSSFVIYHSDNSDNSDSSFEITSTIEDTSDNFYKKRIIEGNITCNLKNGLSNEVIRLENANFRVSVALEK